MGKYDKRSASVRKNTLLRHKKLVEDRGFTYICSDFVGSNTWLYFIKDGEVVSQHITPFRRGLRLRKEYLETCYPEGAGLYKFYKGEELVYVGKTNSFRERFSEHFTKHKTNLKDRESITKIEYCVLNDADTNVLEMYLIAKYRPDWNTKDVPQSNLSFTIEEPTFIEFTGWK